MKFWLSIFSVFMFSLVNSAVAQYNLYQKDFETAIYQEFIEQGITDDIEIELFGGQTEYEFPQANNAKIMLSNFDKDASQGRFSVDAEIFADGQSQGRTYLVGRYFILNKIFVLNKDVSKGNIIKEEDLQETKVRINKIRGEGYYSKEDIIGKQAAKPLKAAKILEKKDLQNTIIMKKGQIVTAIYSKAGLQITSKAEALEDASKDQIIKLLNTDSRTEISGIAVDANSVNIINE